MRNILIVAAAVLGLAVCGCAQEPSLGDVVRDSKKADAPKAKKVFTNDEDADAPKSLTQADPPLKVLAAATAALPKQSDFRCTQDVHQSSNNAWSASILVEIAGHDHAHLIVQGGRDNKPAFEAIVVGDVAYMRDENGWAKKTQQDLSTKLGYAPAEGAVVHSYTLNNPPENLRFYGAENLDGISTFRYASNTDAAGVERFTSIWIGQYDGLLYRSDMQTNDHNMGTEVREVLDCKYGVHPKIEAP